MPYEIKKVKGGFKVQKKGGELTSTGRRFFSNKPLTEEGAKAQMRALYASERNRMESPTRRRAVKSPSRKRLGSPGRTVKSPTRRRKATSPGRRRKRISSPKPRKRTSSPKYKRK